MIVGMDNFVKWNRKHHQTIEENDLILFFKLSCLKTLETWFYSSHKENVKTLINKYHRTFK